MSQVWLLDFHTSELVLLLYLQETNGITVSFIQHFFSSTIPTWHDYIAQQPYVMKCGFSAGLTYSVILKSAGGPLTGSLWQTFILFVLNPAVYFYMNVNIYPICQQYSVLFKWCWCKPEIYLMMVIAVTVCETVLLLNSTSSLCSIFQWWLKINNWCNWSSRLFEAIFLRYGRPNSQHVHQTI